MTRWSVLPSCAALCFFVCYGSLGAAPSQTPPIPAFKKLLYDQVGATWYRYMQTNSQKIALGTAEIALTASADGKITRVPSSIKHVEPAFRKDLRQGDSGS